MSPFFTSPNHEWYFWSFLWLFFQVMSNIPKWDSYQPLHMGYIWAISPVIRRSGASTSRVTSSPAVSGAGTSTAAGRDGLGPRERRCLALVTVRYRGIWTTGTSDLGQIYHNKHEKICRPIHCQNISQLNGDIYKISEPVFCRYRNAQIYHNMLKQLWTWMRKRWSSPWISPVR